MSAVITTWRFVCDRDDSDRVHERLRAWRFVDVDASTYSNGAMHIRVDVSEIPHGDSRCAELMVMRDLERVVSRKKLPSGHPPPPEAA